MPAWFRLTTLMGMGLFFCASTVLAHVSLAGPGFAGQTQVLTFSVGHGCEGADTVSIEVSIPKEVTSLRALPNVFGESTIKSDDTGIVTAVSWTKAAGARAADDQFYQVAIRFKVPDAPFTTLYFPTRQTCRRADGEEMVVDWNQPPEAVAAAKEGEEVPPAPSLLILPVRHPGWNKFTVSDAITTMKVFDDAHIVWSGDAAYSSNPATVELIKSDNTVEELTEIEAGSEIWVKY